MRSMVALRLDPALHPSVLDLLETNGSKTRSYFLVLYVILQFLPCNMQRPYSV
jgi:hypothetical protein